MNLRKMSVTAILFAFLLHCFYYLTRVAVWGVHILYIMSVVPILCSGGVCVEWSPMCSYVSPFSKR